MDRKLTAMLAMDVVGYTRLIGRGEEVAVQRLKRLTETVIEPQVARFSGRLVNRMGDGFLAEFGSVIGALSCAVKIQEHLAAHNRGLSEDVRLRLRMGLHMGDVIVDGDDILGDGVNVASRLEGFARPGGVALSRQVHDHIAGRTPFEFTALGPQEFKNLNRPIEVFSVDIETADAGGGTLRFEEFELDLEGFALRKDGVAIHVEPLVFDLLRCLVENPGRVLSRDELLEKVWGGRVVSEATVAGAIKAARKALGDSGDAQKYIRTVRGRGVQFAGASGTPLAAPPAAPKPSPEAAPPRSAERLIRPKDPRPSIVVIPFAVAAPSAEHPVIAEALASDIMRAMSRLRWLRVIARGTAFRFRSEDGVLERLKAALDARYCLTGSIEMMGRELRLTFELVDLTDMSEVWVDHVFGPIDDVHHLREEVVSRVTACIETQIPAHEGRLAQLIAPQNLDAWSAYHLGLVNMYRFNEPSMAQAISLFERAIALEPTLARAHAGLSFAHYQYAFNEYDGLDKEVAIARAAAAAERSLELDAYDPFCNFTHGRALWLSGDMETSLPWFRRATETSPSFAQGHYATAFASALTGDAAIAHAAAETASGLSPLDPFLWAFLTTRAFAAIAEGEYDQARDWANRAALEPGALVIIDLTAVIANHLAGDEKSAARWADRARRRKPDADAEFYFRSLHFTDPATIQTMTSALKAQGF